jgi:sodium/bile acid cotransporter 7
MSINFLQKNWFPIGLVGVCALTLADLSGIIASGGQWLRLHHGADVIMVFVFYFSGAVLQTDQIRKGLTDIWVTATTMILIFIAAPLIALPFTLLPLSTGLKIGLVLVAIMPTTLSSGVVMTGAAGGNIAQALLITILANILAVFLIPIGLSLMLQIGAAVDSVSIEKGPMMWQLTKLAIIPLIAGILTRSWIMRWPFFSSRKVSIVNQSLVIVIVWMAVSQSRATILDGGSQLLASVLLSLAFHAVLLLAAILVARFGFGPGRREAVIFMGAQKTLPLAVLLQVKLFPAFGLALVYCVIHHFTHLIVDSYLVTRLAKKSN